MLLTIFGQPCVAGKDISIYQSVISRSFIRAAHFDNWRCDSVVATANFGYNAIFGIEFQQRCQYSNFARIFDNLPSVRSSFETRLPLPVLPPVTGQYPHISELLSSRPNSTLEARLTPPISPAITGQYPSVFPYCTFLTISLLHLSYQDINCSTRFRTSVFNTKLYSANRVCYEQASFPSSYRFMCLKFPK
ncbi:MAG: hypothetical protein NXY57DRAFT_1004829 [Lentinula lateritia]|nr:MAG: hypothetical protein NXY57DRAFT_1004829 [Lentinula lateritia]